jgi:hypothetical protein
MGFGGNKFVVQPADLQGQLQKSRYPVAFSEVAKWGKVVAPKLPPLQRLKVPEFFLIADPVGVGSGYGDPLDRPAELVLQDVVLGAVSPQIAAEVYGVVVAGDPLAVDLAATQARRDAVRRERLAQARPVGNKTASARAEPDGSGATLHRVHEYVDVARLGDGRVVWRCRKCSHVYGPASENYKNGALRRAVALYAQADAALPDGALGLAELHEYFCPACGTQVDVETHCPSVEADATAIWDIRLDLNAVEAAADATEAAPRRAAAGAR